MAINLKSVLTASGDEDDAEVQAKMSREEISWGKAFGLMWSLLARHPWLLTASLTIGLLLAVAEIFSLGLIFPFITSLSGGGDQIAGQTKLAFLVPYFEGFDTETKIRFIALALLGVQLVKGVLGYVSSRLAAYQKILFDRDLTSEIFEQIIDLDMRYVNKERAANLYTILHSFATDVTSATRKMLLSIPKAASFAGFAVALFLLSWQLTLLTLVLALITNKSISWVTGIIRQLSRKGNVHSMRLRHVSLEALSGLKVIHLFGREQYAKKRFEDQLMRYQDYKYRKTTLGAAVTPIYTTMMMSMVAGILIVGTYVFDTSEATWVALLTMFLVVLFRLLAPTARYARTKAELVGKLPSFEEVIDFLERDNKPYLQDGPDDFPGLTEEIRFENVSFQYEETEPFVVKDVDLTIRRGQTVALVGGSGAGKSTTVDLLARLYDPSRGRISVDGVDLRQYRTATWRHRLAVVSQSTFLFNDTVRENIRFGRLDATDEEVHEAARQANADEFIAELPESYDTNIGDRGVRLSGGQAQRIAIARAILADPQVLVLDEATSALDTATERKVQEAIDRVSRDRTVVVIAHRLSTVRNADVIVVMEDGRIIEKGHHEELLALQGHYWRYVNMQDLSADHDGPDADGEAPLAAQMPLPRRARQPPAAASNGRHDEARAAPASPWDRVVLRSGTSGASVRANGTVVGDVRLVPLDDVEGEAAALARTRGDIALIRRGTGLATVRLGGVVQHDLPLFLEKAPNGDPSASREVRVKVRQVRG